MSTPVRRSADDGCDSGRSRLVVPPDLERGQDEQRREHWDEDEVGDDAEQETTDQDAGDRAQSHDHGETGLAAQDDEAGVAATSNTGDERSGADPAGTARPPMSFTRAA